MPRVARKLAIALFALTVIVPVPARPSRMSVLPGTAAVTEGTVIPAGSILRVSLHDLSPGIAKDATVAKQTFEAAGKKPIYFELPYNPSVIEPSRLYGVAAAITDSRGQALWETRVPIRVLTLGNLKKVQLVLRPVERPKAPPEPSSFALECDGLRFHVRLSGTSATVTLQDSKVVLPRTEAPSGKRYSDGTTTLAVSGSAAYLQTQEKAYRNCKVRPDPESTPRP
jgi:uncharacterized lipoprotein YbaY